MRSLPLAEKAADRPVRGDQALDRVADRRAPATTAVLALGEDADADLALQLERLEHRRVLRLPQLFIGDALLTVVFARQQQLRRAEQAANMVGAVGGGHWLSA